MPGWPNLSELIVDAAEDSPIGLVGVPLSEGSVTPGRCDLAPQQLRQILRRIGRYDVDQKIELSTRVADHGDVDVHGLSIEGATGPIRDVVAACVARHDLTLLIGGNNAVTRPGVLALGLPLAKVGLITLDAHFDMRGLEGGLGNGNPVRALLEDGLPGANVAQVGIAGFANSRSMHEDAIAAGNLVITIEHVRCEGIESAIGAALDHVGSCEAIVVDCDIDVIDRAQFPAAPGARAAGMTAREFFVAVRTLSAQPRVKLIDLTEWDPPLDPTDLSSLTAGRWLAECVAGFEMR